MAAIEDRFLNPKAIYAVCVVVALITLGEIWWHDAWIVAISVLGAYVLLLVVIAIRNPE